MPQIITLYSNISIEFTRYQTGQITLEDFRLITEESRISLPVKTKELIDLLNGETVESTLAQNCIDLATRVDTQANAIVAGISRDDKTATSQSLLRIESNTLSLLSRLSAHYEYAAESSEKDHSLTECLKKAFKLISENPPPMFEDDLDQYKTVVAGIEITYSEDERIRLNKRILRFPGMVSFLLQLSDIQRRNTTLNVVRNFTPQNFAWLDPLPMNVHELIAGAKIFDSDGFSSLQNARTDIINFFKNGNWLECYVFLMLERAGCSTRIINAKVSSGQLLIEADVLALYANKLILFESKDRMFSNGLSDEDVNALRLKVEKVANLKNPNVELDFVFNVAEICKQSVEEKVREITSESGIETKILFLDNQGTIDNIVAKIRMCLR